MSCRFSLSLFFLFASLSIPIAGQDTAAENRTARIKEGQQASDLAKKAKIDGDFVAAIKAGETSLEIQRELLGNDSPQLISTLSFLADCEEGRENWERATKRRTEVLDLTVKFSGKENYRVTNAQLALRHLEILQRLTAEQRAKLAQATRQNDEAVSLYRTGNYPEAVELAARVVDARDAILGPEHPGTVDGLNNLATFYRLQANYTAAEPLYQRALKISEKTLGPEHPSTATSLNNLAELYRLQANYAAAEPLYQRALKISEKILGPDHPFTASSLNNLALLNASQANYAAAEPLYRRALKIREKAFGPEHRDTAQSLNNLALLYHAQGSYLAAEPLFQRALMIREKALGPDHPDTATIVLNLAGMYRDLGNYAAAEPLFQRSLTIDEKTLGPEHPSTADSVNNLALLYDLQANYAAAEPLYQRALKIREKALGLNHPSTTTSLDNLARFYISQSNYAAAEPLSQLALKIKENTVGPEHPSMATSLNNLAESYDLQANFAAAEPLYQRALRIREKALGPDHPSTATSLTYLADLYSSQADYAAAEPLYQRALKIREKALRPEHPEIATSLDNLAALYSAQKNYEAAESLYQRASRIREKTLGPDHPSTAANLNNLAVLYVSQANYAKAEPLYRQALMINEKALGTEHLSTFTSLNNLAHFHWAHDNSTRAFPLALQTIDRVRQYLERTAAIQSEQQQLNMTNNNRGTFNIWLTVTSVNSTSDEVWNRILPWKGVTTSRQLLLRRALGQDPLYAEYRQVAQQLSTIALSPPLPPSHPEQIAAWKAREPELRRQWETTKQRLETEYTDLEKQLARKSEEFAQLQQRQQVSANDIVVALREQRRPTALVDFAVYYYFGQDARDGHANESNEFRLAAFIARPDRDVQRVELGAFQPISELILQWRETLGQGDAGRAKAQRLRESLWLPLEAKLDGIETVLMSPDGILGQFPWGALPGSKDDSYLIQERAIAIIPIPQFLPEVSRKPSSSVAPKSLLCVGDIDYGGDAGAPADLLVKREAIGRSAVDGRLLQFSKLPGAQPEMASIERCYRNASEQGALTSLDAHGATETAFREQAEKHEWLHLITHGYFAPDAIKNAVQPAEMLRTTANQRQQRALIHPGLLSGLAFAGANQEPVPDKDDGILTAMEVAGLDFSNVQMVVLSACETGLGEVAGGEGLLGLQRSFQVAGAKTCVASLWSVDDAGTRVLMERFYENLWQKKMGKLEALREAQLWALRNPKDFHAKFTEEEKIDQSKDRGIKRQSFSSPLAGATTPPYYWAAFVLSGDWR